MKHNIQPGVYDLLTLQQLTNKRTKQQVQRTLKSHLYNYEEQGKGAKTVFIIKGQHEHPHLIEFGFMPTLPQACRFLLSLTPEQRTLTYPELTKLPGSPTANHKVLNHAWVELKENGLLASKTSYRKEETNYDKN